MLLATIKTTLLRWFLLILLLCISSSMITFMIVRKLPKRYYAETVFVLADIMKGGAGGSGINLSGLGSLPIKLSGKGVEANLIRNLLNSKRMAKDVIKSFDLLTYFNTSSVQHAIHLLRRRIVVTFFQFDDRFRVAVYWQDPKLAAKIANFYVDNLNRLNEEIGISSQKELIKVIDRADIPEFPHGLSTRKVVVIAFVMAFLSGCFLAFVFEYIRVAIFKKEA